jgi:hypothetical protein
MTFCAAPPQSALGRTRAIIRPLFVLDLPRRPSDLPLSWMQRFVTSSQREGHGLGYLDVAAVTSARHKSETRRPQNASSPGNFPALRFANVAAVVVHSAEQNSSGGNHRLRAEQQMNQNLPELVRTGGIQQVAVKWHGSFSPSLFTFRWHLAAAHHHEHCVFMTVLTLYNIRVPRQNARESEEQQHANPVAFLSRSLTLPMAGDMYGEIVDGGKGRPHKSRPKMEESTALRRVV